MGQKHKTEIIIISLPSGLTEKTTFSFSLAKKIITSIIIILNSSTKAKLHGS